MKRYLYILLLISITCNAQVMQKGMFNLPISDDSLVLYYDSRATDWNSITYNSTGNYVTPASDTSYTPSSAIPDSGLVHRIGTSSSAREYVVYDDSDPVILDRYLQGVGDGDEIFKASMDTVFDLSGSGNHAIQTTGAKQPNFLNYTYLFDGTDDVVSAGDIEMDNWTELTVSAWFKTTTTDHHMRVMAKDFAGTPGNFIIQYMTLAGGAWYFYIYDGSSWIQCKWETTSINDGEWHHVVGRVRGNYMASLWIDGNKKHELTFTSGTLDDSDNADMVVGAESNEANNFFDGTIDHVLVYKRELTDAEIETLYKYTKP